MFSVILTAVLAASVVAGLALWIAARLRRRHAPRPPARPPLPADPQWCYLRPGGVPCGPVSANSLLAMLAAGRLEASARAAPTSRNDWHPLADWLPRLGADAVGGTPGTHDRPHPITRPSTERELP